MKLFNRLTLIKTNNLIHEEHYILNIFKGLIFFTKIHKIETVPVIPLCDKNLLS